MNCTVRRGIVPCAEVAYDKGLCRTHHYTMVVMPHLFGSGQNMAFHQCHPTANCRKANKHVENHREKR